MSRETFGKFMAKTVKAKPRRLLNAAVGEHVADVETGYGGTARKATVVVHPRPTGYHLGDLAKCRMAFEVATGLTFDWPGDDDGDGF
jgi:hypothetical protein